MQDTVADEAALFRLRCMEDFPLGRGILKGGQGDRSTGVLTTSCPIVDLLISNPSG